MHSRTILVLINSWLTRVAAEKIRRLSDVSASVLFIKIGTVSIVLTLIGCDHEAHRQAVIDVIEIDIDSHRDIQTRYIISGKPQGGREALDSLEHTIEARRGRCRIVLAFDDKRADEETSLFLSRVQQIAKRNKCNVELRVPRGSYDGETVLTGSQKSH